MSAATKTMPRSLISVRPSGLVATIRSGRLLLEVTIGGRARRLVARAENPNLYFVTHWTNVAVGPDIEFTAMAALRSWREDRGAWVVCELKG